jgi:hypothetical protein
VRWIDVGVEPVGVVAIGANATGVIAIGQLATGVVAVGQLARGVIVVGQLAVGVAAIGQLVLGVGWAAGMVGAGARTGFGLLVWRARPIVAVAVLAGIWWLAAGRSVVDALTREGGIVVDAPAPAPPRCEDEPSRVC